MLVLEDLILLEPEINLLLGILDAVRAVADVAANILFPVSVLGKIFNQMIEKSYNGVVTTDSARGRRERVGSTEDS